MAPIEPQMGLAGGKEIESTIAAVLMFNPYRLVFLC